MIVWSGWGIVVVLIGFLGGLVAYMAGDAFMNTFHLAYGPAQAVGFGIGGVLAAAGIFLFARWRENSSEPGRVFIDEATGQRIEVRRSAGSLFFIPTRYWTWIALALFGFMAFSQYPLTERPPSRYDSTSSSNFAPVDASPPEPATPSTSAAPPATAPPQSAPQP